MAMHDLHRAGVPQYPIALLWLCHCKAVVLSNVDLCNARLRWKLIWCALMLINKYCPYYECILNKHI